MRWTSLPRQPSEPMTAPASSPASDPSSARRILSPRDRGRRAGAPPRQPRTDDDPSSRRKITTEAGVGSCGRRHSGPCPPRCSSFSRPPRLLKGAFGVARDGASATLDQPRRPQVPGRCGSRPEMRAPAARRGWAPGIDPNGEVVVTYVRSRSCHDLVPIFSVSACQARRHRIRRFSCYERASGWFVAPCEFRHGTL
jgi:hypothetical protein